MNKKNRKDIAPVIDASLLELKVEVFRKFSIAFASMFIIPFLSLGYIIIIRTSVFALSPEESWVIASISIFIALCGGYVSYVVIRDILNKLIFYAAQAKQSEQRKSAYVASVSHEFKTPLAIMKTNIFNIIAGSHGQINPEQIKVLKDCDNSIDGMNDHIDGLLNLHKLESGWGSGRKICDLGDIAEHETKKYEILAREKYIGMTMEIRKEELTVLADESNLRSIVNNLLSNAIKYTPEKGAIVIRVFPEAGYVRLECLDTGVGIPKDKMHTLFSKFQRLDATTEGTGLGLFITKEIVEMLKGRIWVESEPGKGTTFTVLLPRNLVENGGNEHGRKNR